jgi:hypothetical protein
MATEIRIETLGTIQKEETLATLHYKIIPNTLVLETQEPYPGYLHHDPKVHNPKSIFMVTKSRYTIEQIVRAAQEIKNYEGIDFDAVPARISFRNDDLFSIRLKDVDNYEIVENLQNLFIKEGIKFTKQKDIKSKAIILVNKFFTLDQIHEDVFTDKNDKNFAYIMIPRKLTWRLFENVTNMVKNNWDLNDFDAAQGTIFRNGRLYDFIRIYSEDFNPDYLESIKKKYLREIEKI